MYSLNDWRSYELYHYGVKGQKWGVRNGPPYPIDRTIHPDIGNPNILNTKLSDVNEYLSNGKAAIKNVIAHDSGYNKIEGEFTREENSKVVNENGYRGNCKEVSFAYAQRVLNKDDVIAKPKSLDGNLHDFANEYFEGGDAQVKTVYGDSKTAEKNVVKQIEKALQRGEYKDGDIGAVSVTIEKKYRNPQAKEDGHSFNWEIIDGEVAFRDSSGQSTATPSDFFKRVDPNVEMEIIDYANVNIVKENADKIIENRKK